MLAPGLVTAVGLLGWVITVPSSSANAQVPFALPGTCLARRTHLYRHLVDTSKT